MTRIGRMHGQPQTANRKLLCGVRQESLSSRNPNKPLLVHPLHPRHPLEPCVLDAYRLRPVQGIMGSASLKNAPRHHRHSTMLTP